MGVAGDKSVKKSMSINQLAVIYMYFHNGMTYAKKLKLGFHLQCCDYDWSKSHYYQLLGVRDHFAHILISNYFPRNFPIFLQIASERVT